MTDHDRATGELGTLLRDRVRDVHPDLAALTSGAIRAGSRIKHRRRLAAASTTLGSLAAAAVLAVQLWPTPSAAPGEFAAAPSPNPPAPSDPGACLSPLHLAPLAGQPTPASCPVPTPVPQSLPVSFQAPGWTCDPPADDKFTCGDGATSVLVTLRPAMFHDDYLHDPDKASPTQFVSDVHGGFFATIQLVRGTVSVDQLAEHLTWN